MTTSYKKPATTPKIKQGTGAWKMATIMLSITCAVLSFLLFQDKQKSDQMDHKVTMTGAHYDHGFINMMIPHHQDAIDEAKSALQNAQHPELKQLAQNIIKSQQAEIDQMTQWRKQWYGE